MQRTKGMSNPEALRRCRIGRAPFLSIFMFLISVAQGCRIDETPQPVTPSSVAMRTDSLNGKIEDAAVQKTAAAPEQAASKKEILYIKPLGIEETPAFTDDLAFVQKAVAAFYPIDVRMLSSSPMPSDAWYAPRKRYRAERILDYLEKIKPADGRIIGIATKDISTTKGRIEDWGILGLATIDGAVCVVSRFRAARNTGGGASEAFTVRYRFAKTVVHELGHNFGLEHCPHKGCIMEDAKGTVKTTDGEYTLCPTCIAALRQYFPSGIIDPIEPPWPKPSAER